jgi:hypothetical protein
MSDCRDFRGQFSAHLDGALTPGEAAALEAHLAQCPACREALEGLRATVARIRAVEPVEPPPWLEARILARIRPQPWTRRLSTLATRPQLGAAALVLVCFTGLLVLKLSGPRKALEPPAPRPAQRFQEQEAAPATAAPARKQTAPRPPPAARDEAPALQEAAPPAAEPPPPAAMGRVGAQKKETAREESKARKAVMADQTQNYAAPASVALRLEASGNPEEAVLEALRQCGGALLARRQGQITARVDRDRLPALRAALEKAGRLRETAPPDLPRDVFVTISW